MANGGSGPKFGILTSTGDLFVGALLENTRQPVLNSILDDRVAAQTSVAKLRGPSVKTVYPGHGQPFSLNQVNEKS